MCLAVPGKIVNIYGDDVLRSATVTFGEIVRNVSLAYTPEARVGDYVLVHVGSAISVVDEAEALNTLQCLKDMGDLAGFEEQP